MILASDLSVAAWRGSVSLFKGATSTRPVSEQASLSWSGFVAIVAPEQPRLVANKEDGEFFLPTVLREAPLVGATLEHARRHQLPLVGKMRSAGHVVEGCAVKLDLDGIERAELTRVLQALDDQNIAFVFYSTHSHGLKPNIRARLILPIDKPAGPDEYRRISQAASEALLGKTLDRSEGYLHQLAGTYVAHPSRAAHVLCLVVPEGFCICSSALLSFSNHPAPKHATPSVRKPGIALASVVDWARIERALDQLDANDFQTWRAAGMMLKVLESDRRARELWLRLTDRAADASKRRNHEACYDPEIMWERFTPYVPADIAVATILARARDAAAVRGRADLERDDIGGDGEEALTYLARHHREFFERLVADCERSKAVRGTHGSKC